MTNETNIDDILSENNQTECELMAKRWVEIADEIGSDEFSTMKSTRTLTQDELDSLLGFDKEDSYFNTDFLGEEITPSVEFKNYFNKIFHDTGYHDVKWIMINEPVEIDNSVHIKYHEKMQNYYTIFNMNIYFPNDKKLLKHFVSKFKVSDEMQEYVSVVNTQSDTIKFHKGYVICLADGNGNNVAITITDFDEFVFEKEISVNTEKRNDFFKKLSMYERATYSWEYSTVEYEAKLKIKLSAVQNQVLHSGTHIPVSEVICPKGFELKSYDDRLYFVKK